MKKLPWKRIRLISGVILIIVGIVLCTVAVQAAIENNLKTLHVVINITSPSSPVISIETYSDSDATIPIANDTIYWGSQDSGDIGLWTFYIKNIGTEDINDLQIVTSGILDWGEVQIAPNFISSLAVGEVSSIDIAILVYSDALEGHQSFDIEIGY